MKRSELDRSEVERAWAHHVAACAGESWHQCRANRDALLQFLTSASQASSGGRMVIDEPTVVDWMVSYAKGKSVRYVALRFAVLGRFLNVLTQARLLDPDPLVDFRSGYNKRSWACLAQAVQSADPQAALASLRPAPALPGPLATYIQPYIELQQSLGKKYLGPMYDLHGFDRFLQAQAVSSLQAVTPRWVEQWTQPMTCISAVRVRKVQCVKRFFDYLIGLQRASINPATSSLLVKHRWPTTSIKPFIFTQQQLASVLANAKQLPDSRQFRCRAQTCFAMLALLSALGLRHGEVCRLRVRDVDLTRQALFVDQTKFHKSRYVPFGPNVGRCLQKFLEVRRTILAPLQDDDPLFVTSWRKPISLMTLMVIFRDILCAVGIQGEPGRRAPRLHDLRHTFAVHRLLRWYREGVDVQSRLPALATFMGHIRPQSTEVYLTITDALLGEANTRFHRHFGQTYDEVRP
jgi:site-specific recombinase XerD